MFKNYLKIALRNLMRRKLFSTINLTGLAFAIAFIILIGQYVYFEYNTNRFFPHIDRIYRLVDAKDNTYSVDYRVRDALVENLPAVKNAGLLNRKSAEVSYGDQVFAIENVIMVDSSFFQIFGFPFRVGNAESALNTIDGVVLSESTAKRILGTADAIYIKKSWMETCLEYPFDLQFYDEAFAAMYRKEDKLATLISIFTVLAVVISCLGILGLAVFQSQQRIKEIGIRKVLGATSVEITAMLTKNFTKWVLLANLLAWPVAYYAANKWLENFAYRIEMHWWMFALAGGIALTIALLTVSTQAMKSALANPVEALRYE